MAKKPEPKKTSAKAKKAASTEKPKKKPVKPVPVKPTKKVAAKQDKKLNAGAKAKHVAKKKKPKEATEFMSIINAPATSHEIIKALCDTLNNMSHDNNVSASVGLSGVCINHGLAPCFRIGYLLFTNYLGTGQDYLMWRNGPIEAISLIAMCEQFLECDWPPTDDSGIMTKLQKAFDAAVNDAFDIKSSIDGHRTEDAQLPTDPTPTQDAGVTPLEPLQSVQTSDPVVEPPGEVPTAAQQSEKAPVSICIKCLMREVFALYNKTSTPTLSLLQEFVNNRTIARLQEIVRNVYGVAKDVDLDFEDMLVETNFVEEVDTLEAQYGHAKPLSDFLETK